MKVGIYCDILKNKETGVENYTVNLINHLQNPILIHDRKIKHHLFEKNTTFSYVRGPSFIGSRLLYSMIDPVKTHCDIIHCPTVSAPFLKKGKEKLIVTVHDISPVLFPNFHPVRRVMYFQHILPRLLRQADRIICDSESTKEDVIEHYNIQRNLRVVHLGVKESFKPTKDKEVLAKYNLPKGYILFVGTLEPRKNLNRLMRAFDMLSCQERLVLVGMKGWGNHKFPDNVIRLNYVAKEDLPAIYSHAKLFVYPSLYEGFGLPVLEAMACGCPVITSNVSSLPEVAGDAALLVDPYNAEGIAESIRKILIDKKLQKDLREKGMDRAKEFSWNKCAEETQKVYEEVYSESSSCL